MADAIDDHRAVLAGVVGDGLQRHFQHVANDLGAEALVALQLQGIDGLLAAQQSHAAAGHDAFFQGGLGGGLGVVEKILSLLHFGLGRGAHADLGHAAGQLGQPLLELLAVVIAGGRFDFLADLLGAAGNRLLLAAAADDRRIVGRNDHAIDRAQIGKLDRIELHARGP